MAGISLTIIAIFSLSLKKKLLIETFLLAVLGLAVILKKRSIFENFMCSVARIAMKNMLNMMQ